MIGRRFSVLALALMVSGASRLLADTFTVTNTNDSGPGSLRQAILDADAHFGLDTIAFAIPGAGLHTIKPDSGLPMFDSPVILDGYTQPGASPNTLAVGNDAVLLIEIDATNITVPVLHFAGPSVGVSDGSTVRGLVISHFNFDAGIALGSGFGDGSNDDTIEGNFIGTDATGNANTATNVAISCETSSGMVIGGTAPATRNVLSSTATAIGLNACSNGIIQGNYVGTNAAGTAALSAFEGIEIIQGANGNLIGGTDAGAGNVFGNFQASAINIGAAAGCSDCPSNDTTIQGNLIGTDATGTVRLTSGVTGLVLGFGTGNLIGGGAPGAGNLISGASYGIQTPGGSLDTWTIQGNKIGTDVTGTLPIPNAVGLCLGSGSGTVGGRNPGEGNIIAFNGLQGVNVGDSGWTIVGNSMFSNRGLGIWLNSRCDLTGAPTPNDAGDADTGSNGLQNFPIIQGVSHPNDSTTDVLGKLDSMPSTDYTLDFYADPACSNFPREFLQGRTYLGSAPASTDASGHASFAVALPVGTEEGVRISATATDPNGNTSEFSQRIIFSMVPASGPASGGIGLLIAGTDFANPTTVTIGGVDASASFDSDHQLSATAPALAPGTVNDVVATTPDGTSGSLFKGWVADFLDVNNNNQFYSFVTTLVSNGITVGVGGGNYGVDLSTLRQQMAVFLMKAKHGLCYVPPPCTTATFTDVPCSSGFAPWIYELVAEGITGGCGDGTAYCPADPVKRQQMAVLLLRTLEGAAYAPPACTTASFADVPCDNPFAPWIYDLVARNITGGCGGGLYCPASPATRGQMAVFLVKTFGLQ